MSIFNLSLIWKWDELVQLLYMYRTTCIVRIEWDDVLFESPRGLVLEYRNSCCRNFRSLNNQRNNNLNHNLLPLLSKFLTNVKGLEQPNFKAAMVETRVMKHSGQVLKQSGV